MGVLRTTDFLVVVLTKNTCDSVLVVMPIRHKSDRVALTPDMFFPNHRGSGGS